MRKTFTALAMFAALAFAVPAGAAGLGPAGTKAATGKILSVDASGITLEDGSRYKIGGTIDQSVLVPGNIVTVYYETKDNQMVAADAILWSGGRVKSIDPNTRQVTLEDGTVYIAPADMDISRFQPGADVEMNYNEKSGVRTASRMSLASRGTIQTIDPANHKITLADGTSFMVGEEVAMDTLQPGDEIRVSYEDRGGQPVATGVTVTKGAAQ